MATIDPSEMASSEQLVRRLDGCAGRLGDQSGERAQALMYAGFLSDLIDGRIDALDPEVVEIVQLITDFCELVESEFPTPASA